MSKLNNRARDAFWLIAAALVVAAGVFGFQLLGALKEPVEARRIERAVPLVDAIQLTPFNDPLPIRGEGFVRPFRQVELASEISGRILTLHPAIENYGRFSQGDVLVTLDDRAAKASLERAEADMAATTARLELNETQLQRAQTLIERKVISQDRVDQLIAENAELGSNLANLRAARERAAIALEYSRIAAPFDGRVLNRSAEIGAVVSPGQALATLVTDRRLEVTVPVSEQEAALIPALFDGGAAPATVEARFGGHEIVWDARISRVDPALDARTRTVGVTVEIVDRPGQDTHDGPLVSGTPPALINAFVRVMIDGTREDGLYAIPSTAVREGGFIWMVHDDSLDIVPIEIAHIDGETTFVRLDQPPVDALLIASGLDAPVEGMTLRLGEAPGQETVLAE